MSLNNIDSLYKYMHQCQDEEISPLPILSTSWFFLILFDCFIVVYNIYIFLQSHPLAQTATMTLLLFLVPALIIPALGSFYYYFSLPLPATLILQVFVRLASSQQSGHTQLKCHPLGEASLTTDPPNIQHITVFNFLQSIYHYQKCPCSELYFLSSPTVV